MNTIHRILLRAVAGSLLVLSACWAADPPATRPNGAPPGPPPGPPRESIEACIGKKAGAPAEFTTRDGWVLKGYCQLRDQQLVVGPLKPDGK